MRDKTESPSLAVTATARRPAFEGFQNERTNPSRFFDEAAEAISHKMGNPVAVTVRVRTAGRFHVVAHHPRRARRDMDALPAGRTDSAMRRKT